MNTKGVIITISKERSLELFADALANAVGSNYMHGYGLELDTDSTYYRHAKKNLINNGNDTPCVEDIWIEILKNGGALTMRDDEGDGQYTSTININNVYEKVQLTPIKNLTVLLSEDGDATDADVLIQTVFFGKVIFG